MGGGCCKSDPANNGAARVFWSGHLTAGHEEARREWLKPTREEDCETKASMPPFNNANKMDIPHYVEVVNAPAFGPNIAHAVMRIFKLPKIQEVATLLGAPLPEYALSKFVQDKMSKVHDMIEHAREDADLSSRMKEPIDRLEKFVRDFEKMKTDPPEITGPEGWQTFVNNHVDKGWESKLHFDHLLSNFGFDKGSSDKLRAVEFTKPDGEKVTFEQHAFRWLSKAFGAYGPEGALTDVVNLTFAMMEGKKYTDQSDVDIAKMIDEFRVKIQKADWSKLWIPTHLFMDAEGDDCMVWVLLTYIHKKVFPKKKLKVLVQLKDELTDLKEKLEKVKVVECEVWLDPNSRNLKAVQNAFKQLMK